MWTASPASFATLVLCLAAGSLGDELPVPAAAGRVSFLAPETLVRLDRGQVVPIYLEQSAATDTTFETTTGDPSVLRVLRPATVLAGETLGYARVRGAGAGETELTVDGTTLRVRVIPLRAEAAVQDRRPTIVVPAPDAVVWGELAVAVETNLGAAAGAPRPPRVRLHLSDGTLLDPDGVLPADGGPTERSVFTLDVSSFASGPLELAVVAEFDDGPPLRGDPVWVTVVHPRAADVFRAECESFRWVERPEAFGAEEPRAGRGADASGSGFVVSAAPDPTWIVPVDVERDGSYQAMLVARGDLGAGGLPSVGMVVDHPYESRASTRIVDRHWRRVPLGTPFSLEAGRHSLGVRYLNDGPASQLSDRVLYLDRFELLRLDTLVVEDVAGTRGDDARATASPMSPMSPMSPIGTGSPMSPGSPMSMESLVPAASPDDAWLAAGSAGVRVAFERPFDDLPLNGRINLEGRCIWNGASLGGAAPHVDLLIDGEPFGTQQAARPLFAFDRGALGEGPHTVQLVARLADGRSSRTPLLTLRVDGRGAPEPPRALHRYSVLDERWVEQFEAALVQDEDVPGHRVAQLERGLVARLELPDDLAGSFDVVLEVCGSGQPTGTATVEIAGVAGDAETIVGSQTVRGWWGYLELGRLSIAPGPAALIVRVTDVEPGARHDDRKPVLRSLMLRERRAHPDRNAPEVELLYPQPGHVAAGVDAVVVHAFDEEDRLHYADVLLDGVARGTFAHVPDAVGYVVLPLVLRDVAPGPHRLSVRVVDHAGNLGESSAVSITVEPPPIADDLPRGPYARAVHLLERFAFGPQPQELARVLLEGETAWLARRLATPGAGDAAALDAARSRLLGPGEHNVSHATLQHLLRTDNPARARFTLWLENHFSTWMRKASPEPEWREHQALHALGPAPFGELLLASATSPAMLWYLDQSASFASRLNENYAREIMELHTVGVAGGYTQDEVTALARLLCGLTVSEEAPTNGRGQVLSREFRFAADLCDGSPAEVLGMRFERPARYGSYDRILSALELLAAHPSTARHVCRELAEHYVSVPAPDDLVLDLEQVFHATGGDLYEVLLALAEHPRFWDAPPRIATPLEYGLRLVRATENAAAIWSLGTFLDRSGMGLYDRATPDGYPEEDAAWTDSNITAQRWRIGTEVPWAIRALVPDELRRAHEGDPTLWRQRVVDVAALRLTGRLLGGASNEAALTYMRDVEGEPWTKVDQLAVLITRLPEASLR